MRAEPYTVKLLLPITTKHYPPLVAGHTFGTVSKKTSIECETKDTAVTWTPERIYWRT